MGIDALTSGRILLESDQTITPLPSWELYDFWDFCAGTISQKQDCTVKFLPEIIRNCTNSYKRQAILNLYGSQIRDNNQFICKVK